MMRNHFGFAMAGMLVLTLVACGRHKTEQPSSGANNTAASPHDQLQAPSATPPPPPQVVEPPGVQVDSATQKLLSGELHAVGGQSVSGAVSILKTDHGYALRIDGLHIDGGLPQLDILLTTQTTVRTAADVVKPLYLGAIEDIAGVMSYPIQGNVAVTNYHALVLMLHGKDQVFATAQLGST